MPERLDFWGLPSSWNHPEILVYVLMGLSSVILLVRLFLRMRVWWQNGLPEKRWNRPFLRIYRVIQQGFFQLRILSQRYPGVMHVALSWSFLIFFLGTALATLNSHFFIFLTGNTYLAYKLILDLFGLLFLVGAVLAAYRRFIQKPDRLSLNNRFTVSLTLLTLIVLGGLVIESLRLAVEKPAWCMWSPVGCSLGALWNALGATPASLVDWHTGIWLFHLGLVAFFIVSLPVSTLFHILAGPINIFFSDIDHPFGYLPPIPETKAGEQVFASSVKGLTWKQLLDGDACTECGRCQDVCPAYAAGTPLSPKQVILDIRESLHTAAKQGKAGDVPLVGERITPETLWSCTTCGACIHECPVLIEHINAIVAMRRHLVIEGDMDAELQDALSNLGRYGNSFGQSDRMRARWTQSITPQIKDARREPVEYLWYLGDYASFNPALTEITNMTAEVFRDAGVDFGILYESERNSGNDVRRAGEEGLFEMLAEKNVSVLNRCKYQAILTTDPHTYHTLKNEYAQFGLENQTILHYTELLDQLITQGRIKLTKQLDHKVTYHDPCYLGRYNGIYRAPRAVIKATGCELIEMPRSHDHSFCCGAGGGHIWMAEGKIKERPSELRIKEACTLPGVSQFIVTCPKDITMFRDAVKTTGNDAALMVRDLIELVKEAQ